MNTLEIVLGGLLHDIGKFMQRSFPPEKGLSDQNLRMKGTICPTRDGRHTHRHVLYTYEFMDKLLFFPPGLNKATVAALAGYHHRPDTPAQAIIAEADQLSAGMERDDEAEGHGGTSGFRRVRLQSVAAALSLDNGTPGPKAEYDLSPLTPDRAIPLTNLTASDLTADYAGLWAQFVKEWSLNRCPDSLGFINRADSVLERFAWCLPSATNVRPDISLYDHLKTTAAIAACLFEREPDKEKPFFMVAGALTGIQKYIFDLRQGAGGLARRLRARSFNVAMYTTMLAQGILGALGLPLTQRILSAGGKFHLLLPNTTRCHQALAYARQKAMDWLFETSSGEIGLTLAGLECGREDLRLFGVTVTRLHQELRNEKDQAGRDRLVFRNAWREESFVLPPLAIPEPGGLCTSCQKQGGPLRPAREKDEPICDVCHADGLRGRRLPKSRFLALYDDGSGIYNGPLGSYTLIEALEEIPGQPVLIVAFEGLGGIESARSQGFPLVSQMWGRYVPRDQAGDVVPFDEMARRSKGRESLGWLKMDVDDLGWIFAEGLKDKGRDHTSISRAATLSRTLEVFFSGYLDHLLRRDFPDVYLVYSGGDDLLAVGPWDAIFDLAKRIRDEFRRFTAGNPAWTLSAGITLARPHTPVLLAVEAAERHLEASKSVRGSGVQPWPEMIDQETQSNYQPTKDRLTAFGTSIPWMEFVGILSKAKQIKTWLDEETLRSGQVMRLLKYSEMYRLFQSTKDTRHFMYVPLLIYDLKRNWEEKSPVEAAAKIWAAELVSPENVEMKSLRFMCEYSLNGIQVRKEGKEQINAERAH